MTAKQDKILLVEEDENIIRGYTFFLERAGYEVVNIVDGSEAVEAIRREKPSLVLLDLVLPGMHGFEILETLQKKRMLSRVPVVIVSNLCQDADIEKCYSLGATDYIIKSNFSGSQVVERIGPIIKKKRK